MNSVVTLCWTGLLLFIIVYVSAIFMTIFVGKDCHEFPDFAEGGFEVMGSCLDYFGTIPNTMLTLFQALTLEWSEMSRPLLREKPMLIIFFIVFIFTTSFGLLNIVVGIIVEDTR